MRDASLLADVATGRAAVRKRFRYGLKVVLALLALAWLIGFGGWRQTATCLAGVSPFWFGLGLATYLAGQTLCAWKWSLLAHGLGFRRPFRFYWVNYLGAMFPSLFLPTSVGGDVFRTVALARNSGPRDGAERPDSVGATVSVLADRGTGLLAMSWIASIAALVEPVDIPDTAARAIYLFSAALTVGFLLPFLLRGPLRRIFPTGLVARVLECWDRPGVLLTSAGVGFVFNALVAVIYICIGRALALPVHPLFYFFLSPIVSVAAISPVTINGIGERALALTWVFRLVGIAADRAVAFGLVWTALVALASLVGGLVLFLADRQAGWTGAEPRAAG